MKKQIDISQSVTKRDHAAKVSGRSLFTADYPMDGVLYAKILRSEKAHARILRVDLPPLPEGYYYADAKDIPGSNNIPIVLDDHPVFARDTVNFIGEAIGILGGPDEKKTEQLLKQCRVVYEEMEPVLDVRTAPEVFFEYQYAFGDTDRAFREADRIFEEEFTTGYQEHAYLETQGVRAEIEENGRMFVHGSMQNAWYAETALEEVLWCDDDKIHVRQDVTGGAFGGKEEYPSILACQTAVLARKAGTSVRCVLGRREDITVTTKRHPSISRYRAAVKAGRITGLEIEVTLNAGAYTTVSSLVLQRALFMAVGVYGIPAYRVHGRAVKTNTVPCGAFRGFGGPQIFFASELFMSHIARDLRMDSLMFRRAHLLKDHARTSTGGSYHFHIPLAEMIEEIDEVSQYRRKRKEYAAPQHGRYRRGIGLSLASHGGGLNGSAEEVTGSTVRLRKDEYGRVTILAGNGEIGQGLRTTFPKIVAEALEIPFENVFYEHPDTAAVPDSSLTAGSRSIMIVGELLRRAALKLKAEWKDGMVQEAEEHFRNPSWIVPFDFGRFEGDAYQDYSWSVSVIETEIDTYTGSVEFPGVWGCFDVGTPIDQKIVIGQMEGGFLQGIGAAVMEKMNYDGRGFIRNNNLSDYLIPCSLDCPNLTVLLHENNPGSGPFGAKGAGELPMVGVWGAYIEAIEQALGNVSLHHVPFTAEDVVHVLNRKEQ